MGGKWLAACGIAALALFWTGLVQAAGYPTERQLRQALSDIDALVQAEGLTLDVIDARKEGVVRPLYSAGLNLGSNSCVVFFNTQPEDGLTQFFAAVSERDLAPLLRAISVHEVTHCIEQREAYVRQQFDKVLPATYQRRDMTLQGYFSVVRSGAVETWGEALADISSVLYLKQSAPDQWLHLARHISAMRRDLAKKWPQHDTSPWLDRLIGANPDPVAEANLFDAAFRYRRQFWPG